jgi:type II secretory pathway pseudopilin PulG
VKRVRAKPATGRMRQQRGYALLGLLLLMAVVAIAATVAAPHIAFQIRRDREEELVHRGVQYSRALRRYVKANGHYPNSLDELAGTSGQRWIRKLYKDPVTGKDFRLLHMNDVQPGMSVGIANQPNQNGGLGSGSNSLQGNSQMANAASNAQSGNAAETNGADPGNSDTNGPTDGSVTANQPGLQIFGVASFSKAHTIREFNHKSHYNDWYFFYDPNNDRGYEIKGPTLPGGFGQPAANISGGTAAQPPADASQPPAAPTN